MSFNDEKISKSNCYKNKNSFIIDDVDVNCRPKGWQRLLSARASCKYVNGISQNLQSASPY